MLPVDCSLPKTCSQQSSSSDIRDYTLPPNNYTVILDCLGLCGDDCPSGGYSDRYGHVCSGDYVDYPGLSLLQKLRPVLHLHKGPHSPVLMEVVSMVIIASHVIDRKPKHLKSSPLPWNTRSRAPPSLERRCPPCDPYSSANHRASRCDNGGSQSDRWGGRSTS